MKKLISTRLLLAALFITFAMTIKAKAEKVILWHKGHFIKVSINALDAHFNHGDKILYQDELLTGQEYYDKLEGVDEDLEEGDNEDGEQEVEEEGEQEVEEEGEEN